MGESNTSKDTLPRSNFSLLFEQCKCLMKNHIEQTVFREKERIMRKMIYLCFIAAIFMLSGCQAGTESPDDKGTPTSVRVSENIVATAVMDGDDFFASPTNDGVYFPSEFATYFDFDSADTVTLCSQSGCLHTDNTCAAWLGDISLFAEYHGRWYVVSTTENNGFTLDEVSYKDRERKTVCSLEGESSHGLFPVSAGFSAGYAYISVQDLSFSAESDESENRLYRVDIKNGEKDLLFCDTELECFRFLGASSNQIAILYTKYDDTSYQNATYELRIYDSNYSEYTTITSSELGYLPTIDPKACYGSLLIYQANNEFWLYDFESSTSQKLSEQENVVNYWLVDGKLFTIVDQGKAFTLFFVDLNGGEPTEISAQRGNEAIQFSLMQETQNYFIGIYRGQICFIKKTLFYNGKYEEAANLYQNN